MSGLTGVRLNTFWGILLQIFNGVPVLEQVDHMCLSTVNLKIIMALVDCNFHMCFSAVNLKISLTLLDCHLYNFYFRMWISVVNLKIILALVVILQFAQIWFSFHMCFSIVNLKIIFGFRCDIAICTNLIFICAFPLWTLRLF